MIYGHGVEEHQTVRSYLESQTGLSVLNMGIQGASIHTEYQIFKHDVIGLSPEYAFLFYLDNDISDLSKQLSISEMEALIAQDINSPALNYFEQKPLSIMRKISSYFEGVYFLRLITAAGRQLWHQSISASNASIMPLDDTFSLELRFHITALMRIQQLSQQNSIKLIHVFISRYRLTNDNNELKHKEVLEQYSNEAGIPFIDLSDYYPVNDVDLKALFLVNDNHFSPRGAEEVSKILRDYLQNQ
jgi:hypothetical protein